MAISGDYREEDFKREFQGDPFQPGRHKNEEKLREVEWVEKLRQQPPKLEERPSTTLSPNAPKPEPLVIAPGQSLDEQSRTDSRLWKNSSTTYLKGKPVGKPVRIKMYKKPLPPPKLIGARILSPEEAVKLKRKPRKRSSK